MKSFQWVVSVGLTYKSKAIIQNDNFFSYGCPAKDKSEYLAALNQTEERFQDNPIINWDAIVWVRRPLYMWVIHVVLAIISLAESILLFYLGYKVRHHFFHLVKYFLNLSSMPSSPL